MNRPLPIALFSIALVGTSASALAQGVVYVPTGSAGEILAIDGATDTIIGTIAGTPDVHGLAATPDGAYLVAGAFSEAVSGAAPPPPKPTGMAQSDHEAHHAKPAARSLLDGQPVSFVSLVGTSERSVVRRIEVPGAVHHVAALRDGRHAVATHPNGGRISVIDLTGGKVAATVMTGPQPNYAVVTADGRRVYISNAGNDTVSEIDTARWIVRRNFVVGASPEHMVLSADGKRLFVNNADAGTVSEISLATGDTARTYAVGGEIHGLDLSDDGETLFVSGKEENKLVAIDLRHGQPRVAPLVPAPYHLTVIPGTGKIYVSSRAEPKIWVVDQQTLRPLREIRIRGEGHQMVVM